MLLIITGIVAPPYYFNNTRYAEITIYSIDASETTETHAVSYI